jgi:ubiquinone biosynthesis protein
MSSIKKFWRLMQINFILIRHGLDDVVLSIPIFAKVRFIRFLNPWNWRANKKQTRGIRVREAFEELGPIFVKFGQALSVRHDLLPDDIVDELAKLQDRVPPFSGAQARNILEKIFEKPLNALFLEFDETPLASASIAQVHAARLPDGTEVAVTLLA